MWYLKLKQGESVVATSDPFESEAAAFYCATEHCRVCLLRLSVTNYDSESKSWDLENGYTVVIEEG